MDPNVLVGIVRVEAWGFVLGLTGIVSYQMMTGRIELRGLLRTKSPDDPESAPGDEPPGDVSPTRVQLLLLTLGAAFTYLAMLPLAEPGSLPDIPLGIAALFGGSASIYLGGKSVPLWRAVSLGPEPDTRSDTESDE